MVGADAVAVVVRSVMGEGAQGRRRNRSSLWNREQGQDKIAAAHVMGQVAEEMSAVRVVTHVLNDGAAVGVTVGFCEDRQRWLSESASGAAA